MKSNNYINVFVLISCVLFLFFFVGLFNNPYGSQRNIFFVGMNDFFMDFFNPLRYTAERDPYFSTNNDLGERNYFPLSFLIFYTFSKLDNYNTMTREDPWNSKMGLMSAFLFMGFMVFLLFLSLNNICRKCSNLSPTLIISLVLSYIFFFSIERGNIIILAAAFVGFFICYYDSENKYERLFAVICLAFAATLKVYPVILGFLYFEKKQYKEIFLGAVITLLLVFLPFIIFKRGFSNIPQLVNNLKIHTSIYGFTRSYPRLSLTHLVFRFTNLLNFSENLILSFSNLAQVITYIISFVSILFSCLIKNKWIKISLLTMVIVFLPTNSGLYCGLYIFPMIILFFASIEERSKLFNIFTIIVFLIFLNPYQFVIEDKILNYLLTNIALLTLWLVLLIYSGKQIITSNILSEIKTSITNKTNDTKKYLLSQKGETINT